MVGIYLGQEYTFLPRMNALVSSLATLFKQQTDDIQMANQDTIYSQLLQTFFKTD